MRGAREAVISGYGWLRWRELVGHAVIILKEDRRLVGLDRLRLALAREAADRAIGCPVRTFAPSKDLWRSASYPPVWCDELIAACALRLQLDGRVAR